jgi:minor extracellular serine protease Vpr
MKRSVGAACAVASLLGFAAVAVAEEPDAGTASSAPAVINTFRGLNRYQVDPSAGVPAGLGADAVVSATVELVGDGVSEQQGDAIAKQTAFDEAAAVQRVAAQQNAVIPAIQATGATVTGQLTHVINGVRVRVEVADLGKLGAVPGVARVQVAKQLTIDNGASNDYSGVPAVWEDLGYTGAGMKIGIIDDGIDYLHADFGGNGDPAEYAANDRTVVEEGSFPTVKVAGGYDFVGDDYDAGSDPEPNESDVPVPDPDPLACGDHGTHVAGTAGGAGVTADGATFAGPYDAATMNSTEFLVSPGSAPEATLYAYKVFGCDGSVNDDVIVAAIDMAVADGVDVINMSLGSAWGRAENIEADAIDNATAAGVLVVASAGNEGANAYMTGAPAASDRALSVAANDTSFKTLTPVLLSGGITSSAVNANFHNFTAPLTGDMVWVGLGCEAADYAAVAGKVAVTVRGTCARVDRATFGDAAGAVAVIMVNNAPGRPPVEGEIEGVDIPFVGIDGVEAAAVEAAATAGASVTMTAGEPAPNPGYSKTASFTSGGPRNGDSGLKPEVMAPGVSVKSAKAGGGTAALRLSGTSMSAPHTAGIAALVRQAHPDWSPMQVKAAMQNTADPTKVPDYDPRRAGTGAVDAQAAVSTVAYAGTANGRNSISFGFRQVTVGAFASRSYRIYNTGTSAITYDLVTDFSGDDYDIDIQVFPASVTVPAGGSRPVFVTMYISAEVAAALPGAGAAPAGQVTSVYGAIVASPRNAAPGVHQLRTAFNVVPHGTSDIRGSYKQDRKTGKATARFRNYGNHAGDADIYQWIITDPAGDTTNKETADIVDVGVQSYDAEPLFGPDFAGDRLIYFNVNTAKPTSTQATHVLDARIDSNRDGTADFQVLVADAGLLADGSPTGVLQAIVVDLSNGEIVDQWDAAAPMNGSTIQFPILASDIGATGPFDMVIAGDTAVDTAPADDTAVGTFDPFNPAVTQGATIALPANSGWVEVPVTIDAAQVAIQKPFGWLIASVDDAGGFREGDTIRLRG